jgi:sulfur carrier protein
MKESELGQAVADGPLVVNGVDLVVPLPCTVLDLLARLEMAGKRVAVSVDRSVVPRSRHAEAIVRAGNRVEILEAVGGG